MTYNQSDTGTCLAWEFVYATYEIITYEDNLVVYYPVAA